MRALVGVCAEPGDSGRMSSDRAEIPSLERPWGSRLIPLGTLEHKEPFQ